MDSTTIVANMIAAEVDRAREIRRRLAIVKYGQMFLERELLYIAHEYGQARDLSRDIEAHYETMVETYGQWTADTMLDAAWDTLISSEATL